MNPAPSITLAGVAMLVLSVGADAQIEMATPDPALASREVRDISGVLAQVGREEFKLDQIRPYLAKLDEKQKAALAKDPAALNKFVRTFLVQRLLLSEALESKWDQQPDAIIQLQRLRENAIADGYLESVVRIPADYPGEAELQAAYEANKSAFRTPRQLRLAQILIEAPKETTGKTSEMAEARVALVQKALEDPKADFVKVAEAKATETSNAIRGGEVGWVPEQQIPPELREAALKLPPGGISDPIRLPAGWVILKVFEVKEPATAPFEDVRAVLVSRLREVKTRQASEAYINTMLEKTPITINEPAITRLLAPAAK